MGKTISKFCCCDEDSKNKIILLPKSALVDRNIYTLRELSEEDNPETDFDHPNESVQTLREIKINKSIIICRKNGLPSEEYLILDELGEGSYGIVLKVAHKITQNIRALKIIKKLNLEKEFSKTKLYDEIKILKGVDHPNIIKIFEFFEDEENYYMVTEYCPEGDLARKIEKIKFFSERNVKILLFQILSAVCYLHSMKIIHGDLKLENILIDTLSMKTTRTFKKSLTYDLSKFVDFDKTHILENGQNSNINNINIKNDKENLEASEINKKLSMTMINSQNNNNIINNEIDEQKFNQTENFDLNFITQNNSKICESQIFSSHNNNLIQSDNNKNNNFPLNKSESLNFDLIKNNSESISIVPQKRCSAGNNLLTRKIQYLKFSQSHKNSKTLFSHNSKNLYSKYMNNNDTILRDSIIEETFCEMSKLNTERKINQNNISPEFPLEKEAEEKEPIYVPPPDTNRNEKSSGRIFTTEENISEENNNYLLENYIAKNFNYLDNMNGQDIIMSKSNRGNNDNATNKSNNVAIKFKIPNLNLKSLNNDYNTKSDNVNNESASFTELNSKNNIPADNSLQNEVINKLRNGIINENDNLRKLNTIEELQKHLSGNILIKSLKKEEDLHTLQSKRSLKNTNNKLNNLSSDKDNILTNRFETLSNSNTISINTDRNNSMYQQQQKELNKFFENNFSFNVKNSNNNNIRNNNKNNSEENKKISDNDKRINEKHFKPFHSIKAKVLSMKFDSSNNVINDQIFLDNCANYEIKLIDFGCSKMFKRGKRKFRDLIGSLFYVAPEVIKNNYNEKCDLWSCGVIMYFLLAGFPPFFSLSEKEVFEQILSADYSLDFEEFDGVSKSAKDLIKKLLELNPKKRLTAKEALEHEFFAEISSNRLNEYNLDLSVLENLKKNKIEKKFQQAVVSYIAYNFARKDEIANLRKIFKMIDKDCDGRISSKELFSAWKIFNLEISEKEIIDILDSVDSDKSGFLEFEEFISAAISKKSLLTEENLRAAFSLFDQDKNGFISRGEIKNILIGNNTNIPDKVLNDIIDQIDQGRTKNSNGEINFEDFKKIMFQVIVEE